MRNELAYVKEADPLLKFRRMLLRYKRLTEEELLQIETDAKKELSAANRKALSAPDPDPKSIYDFVIPEPYQPQKYKEGIHGETEGEKTSMVNAINETLKAEFRYNPNTFIWGQDVARDKRGRVQCNQRNATGIRRSSCIQCTYCRRLYCRYRKRYESF